MPIGDTKLFIKAQNIEPQAFLSETPNSSWETAIFHKRPQAFYRRQQIFNVDSRHQSFSLEAPSFLSKTQDFSNVGLTRFIGDLQFFILETAIFHQRPKAFIKKNRFSTQNPAFHWRPQAFIDHRKLSSKPKAFQGGYKIFKFRPQAFHRRP